MHDGWISPNVYMWYYAHICMQVYIVVYAPMADCVVFWLLYVHGLEQDMLVVWSLTVNEFNTIMDYYAKCRLIYSYD